MFDWKKSEVDIIKMKYTKLQKKINEVIVDLEMERYVISKSIKSLRRIRDGKFITRKELGI